MSDNIRLEKSRNIYELWRTGEGDMDELAIGLYDLTAHYEALLDDYEKLEAKLSKLRENLREADDRFDRIQDEFVQPYAALKIKLSKMEEFRALLDEFQQEAQTRWKDYAPEMINARIVKLKEALAGGEEA